MSDDLFHIYVGRGLANKGAGAFIITDLDEYKRIFTVDENLPKEHRHYLSQSLTAARPKIEDGYSNWNGLQVIDLDIKSKEVTDAILPLLRDKLFTYPSVLAVVKSSSGTGIHVHTIVQPTEMNEREYMDNFEKHSILTWNAMISCYNEAPNDIPVKLVMEFHPDKNKTSKVLKDGTFANEHKMFDLATAKISQPILVGYNPDIQLNDNFELSHPLYISESDYESDESISTLKAIFDKARHRQISVFTEYESADIEFAPNINDIIGDSYDNHGRYNIAYTLVNLYKVDSIAHEKYNDILKLFHKICSGNHKYDFEKVMYSNIFKSAVNRQHLGTAPLTTFGINALRKHGFQFLLEETQTQIASEDVLDNIEDDVRIGATVVPFDKSISLQSDEYITDKYSDLLEIIKIKGSKTFLVAEPGTGKTVYARKLFDESLRVAIVMPFISVVESKFEESEEYNRAFGSKHVKAGAKNQVMTFDKFANMSLHEINNSFDIVVIDESHLLLTSSFRGLVPSRIIDHCRNMKSSLVMMTGTPIIEHIFVNFDTCIKFTKQKTTSKSMHIVMCDTPTDKTLQSTIYIANAIRNHKRVICPIDDGNLKMERIKNGVESILGRPIKSNYYKKENQNLSFMHDITNDATINDLDLLFCSSYLSVGVDIEDKFDFEIVYVEDFSAHAMEQFNNRLRKTDIKCTYFVNKLLGSGKVRVASISKKIPNLFECDKTSPELDDLLAMYKSVTGKNAFDFFLAHSKEAYFEIAGDSVKFHATCYVLNNFEKMWKRFSEQLSAIYTQMKDFGYKITKSVAKPLTQEAIEEILLGCKTGHRLKKAAILDDIAYLQTMFENQAFFDLVVSSNRVKIVKGPRQCYTTDDSKLYINLSEEKSAGRLLHTIKSLSKYYNQSSIMQIWSDKSVSELERIQSLVELMDLTSDGKLAEGTKQAFNYLIDKVFNKESTCLLNKRQFNDVNTAIANIYEQSCSNHFTAISKDKIRELSKKFFKIFAVQGGNMVKDRQVVWELRKIPEFTSSSYINRNAQQAMLLESFGLKLFETQDNTQYRISLIMQANIGHIEQHVIDTEKSFNKLKEQESEQVVAIAPTFIKRVQSVMTEHEIADEIIENTIQTMLDDLTIDDLNGYFAECVKQYSKHQVVDDFDKFFIDTPTEVIA